MDSNDKLMERKKMVPRVNSRDLDNLLERLNDNRTAPRAAPGARELRSNYAFSASFDGIFFEVLERVAEKISFFFGKLEFVFHN